MKMQEKFQTALEGIAEERDLDLVVEHTYANVGWYSFQPRAGFEPVLRFPFSFQTGYSSFDAGARPTSLGGGPRGGAWSHVEGGDHEKVLARVKAVLDGEPDTVRIVILPDDETWGALDGSRVCEVPSSFGVEAIDEAVAAGQLDGRGLR